MIWAMAAEACCTPNSPEDNWKLIQTVSKTHNKDIL